MLVRISAFPNIWCSRRRQRIDARRVRRQCSGIAAFVWSGAPFHIATCRDIENERRGRTRRYAAAHREPTGACRRRDAELPSRFDPTLGVNWSIGLSSRRQCGCEYEDMGGSSRKTDTLLLSGSAGEEESARAHEESQLVGVFQEADFLVDRILRGKSIGAGAAVGHLLEYRVSFITTKKGGHYALPRKVAVGSIRRTRRRPRRRRRSCSRG